MITQRSKLRAITHRSAAGRSSVTLLGGGAAHITGGEVLPEVWVDKATVDTFPFHQEGLGDSLEWAVPIADVVLVRPHRLARVFDVPVAAIARDLRAEPRGAVPAVEAPRGLSGVLHPARPPLQHRLAAHKGGSRDFDAKFLRDLLPLGEAATVVNRFLLVALAVASSSLFYCSLTCSPSRHASP